MTQRKKKVRIRYDRILVTGAILLVLVFLLGSCIKSCGKDDKPAQATKPLSTTAPPDSTDSTDSSGDPSGTTTGGTPADYTGYTKLTATEAELHKGQLVLVNREHEYVFPSDTSGLQLVYEKKLSTYQAKDMVTQLDGEAMTQFNALMSAYYNKTYNVDIMLINGYRTKETQDSYYSAKSSNVPGGFSEYHTGLALDLGIFPKGANSYYYTANGDYAWIQQNMPAYGFIQRYPAGKEDATGEKEKSYQFRYVGVPHASYITENNLCLEEYITQLKDYKFGSKTLKLQIGETQYEVYYIPADSSGSTTLYVPAAGSYTVSGNNVDGFIITAQLN